MKGIISATLASVLVGTALSQSSPNTRDESATERVWSSIAWVMHGDRSPLDVPGFPPNLTPLGAQQLVDRGRVLRNRYIVAAQEPDSFDVSKLIGAKLVGLSTNAIDNTQLDILTGADSYNFHSALALMQGLYPPSTRVFNGTDGIAAALLANTEILDYPLEGYQYPVIRSPSVDDPEFVYVDANKLCPQYLRSLDSFKNDTQVEKTYNETLVFYKAEWKRIFHGDNIAYPLDLADYHHAYAFYDAVQYLYVHDNATKDQLNSSFIEYMGNLAATEQREKHGNLTVFGKEEGDKIRAIAGRTMAGKVMEWFDSNFQTEGRTNKLNMAFTSIEPFFAFFSLSGLIDGPSGNQFRSHVPNPSAAMIFELFSKGGSDSVYPSDEDLWVRFLYDDAKSGSLPQEYALFGNGNSQSVMPLAEFRHSMGEIALNSSSHWCDVCDSSASFCLVAKGTTGGDGNKGGSPDSSSSVVSHDGQGLKMDPTIAGAIGAASAIAVIGLGLLAATLCAGLRFHRAGSEKRREQERMIRMLNLGSAYNNDNNRAAAPDADVTYARNGIRHERVGSWEMHNGFGTNPYGTSNTDRTAGLDRVYTNDAGFYSPRPGGSSSKRPVEDDQASYFGAAPTKPRDFSLRDGE
ncbi:phosphoglycerate mutase-like protein [Neurospora tetrasperma FGSC 2509]|nr:phosphoglycerate mutase-like protein [Neurospora tetrasperma FGSC 2509]